MKHVLITGGAGFIGSHLCKALLEKPGIRVTAVDNFDPFYNRAIKERNIAALMNNPAFHFIQTSLLSIEKGVFPNIGPVDAIVHLAAKAGVRPSILDPVAYEQVNVEGTVRLLDWAIEHGVPHFVFASSSSVYGVNPHVPWTETEPLMPISPYASTKLTGEQLGYVYHHLHGIHFLALRFFTVFGPSQRPDLAIHKFFRAIREGKPIPVFGNGSTYRDYTYVEDIIQGVLAAIDYQQTPYEIINLGNNQPVSLMTLIRSIEEVAGQKAVLQYMSEQPGDVPRTYANTAKAKELLGFAPVTPLIEGLRKFYDWFSANEDLLLPTGSGERNTKIIPDREMTKVMR